MKGFKDLQKDVRNSKRFYKEACKYVLTTGWQDKKNEAIARYNASPKDKRPSRDILGVFLKQKKLVEEIANALKLVVLRFTKNGNVENFEGNLKKVGIIASDNVKVMLGSSSGNKLFPENSSAVIKRKGKNTPMVNTENLKDSISSWFKKQI